MRRLVSTLFASAFAASSALAESSHHQAGSGAGPISTIGIDLPSEHPAEWHFRVFPSILSASEKFDDAGSRTALLGLNSIKNYSLNIFAERRLGDRWAFSVLTAWQILLMNNNGTRTEFNSLADSLLNLRYTVPN